MSCPYTSPQNGKAERIIRSINNVVRSLLFQASMPPSYWVEALLTVNFRQPSHEFTFGVGMSFISYNKFVCACRFWSLVFMQGFSVENKTSEISSLSTS
jgi:hypothetical protein